MPSSTSSSERAVPGGDWGRTWLVAVAVLVGGVVAIEHAARAKGHRPSVADEPTLWAISRNSVDGDARVVAILGSSRMALAFDRDAFAAAAPTYRGVQLAIHRSSAVPAIVDLAADDAFTGTAIVDVSEWDLEPRTWDEQKSWLDQPRALWRMPGAILNRYLAAYAQSQLAVLDLGGRQVIGSALGHRSLPKPNWVVTDRDRTQHGDYSFASATELASHRDRNLDKIAQAPKPPAEWLADLAPAIDAARRIHARGGSVVFVRMPISGVYAQRADELYPRASYWDAFSRAAAAAGAVTVHYRDVPAMTRFTLPDDTHLDEHDQGAFTTALVDELHRRGLLSER